MVTMNSSGATARSWNSRTAKLKRPIGADSSLFSASTGTTIAVEDREKAAPKIERRRGLLAEQRRRSGDRRRADDDLRETEPEHQPAQALQTLEGKFEPHREEQHDDPEGREPIDRIDVGDREPVEPRRPRRQTSEARRAQRDAGQQIAEDGADVNAEKQRRDHARRDEEKQRLTIDRCVCGVHGSEYPKP